MTMFFFTISYQAYLIGHPLSKMLIFHFPRSNHIYIHGIEYILISNASIVWNTFYIIVSSLYQCRHFRVFLFISWTMSITSDNHAACPFFLLWIVSCPYSHTLFALPHVSRRLNIYMVFNSTVCLLSFNSPNDLLTSCFTGFFSANCFGHLLHHFVVASLSGLSQCALYNIYGCAKQRCSPHVQPPIEMSTWFPFLLHSACIIL